MVIKSNAVNPLCDPMQTSGFSQEHNDVRIHELMLLLSQPLSYKTALQYHWNAKKTLEHTILAIVVHYGSQHL